MKIFSSFLAAGVAAALCSPLSQAATVTGTVKDPDGNPISGVRVRIEGTARPVYTDEAGQFRFDNLTSDHAHLHLYSPEHLHGDREVEFASPEQVVELAFVLAPTRVENVEVTANPLVSSVLESTAPVSVLSGDALSERQAPTLGETLNGMPGVHSSYFGPVASSPVIRGSDGPRVKIVQNGLDVGDASRVGPDHGVSSEASSAQQIEVLRGPATLQFGSGAIGGVVNVVDERIPSQLPDATTGEIGLRHDTRANEKFARAELNTAIAKLALHADAFTRETDDFEIPGFAEQVPDEGEAEGILENSAIDAQGFTLGASFVDDFGHIGIAYQSLENLYGIPGHAHEHEEEEGEHEEGEHEEEEEEQVRLDSKIDRWQVEAEIYSPIAFIKQLRYRGAYSDYEHRELEGDEIGTIFRNEAIENRLDLQHESINGWHGVVGVHQAHSDYEAIGEEAFTPPNTSDMAALYIVEEKRLESVIVKLGARIERNELEVDESVEVSLNGEDGEVQVFDLPKQSFTSLSLSAGTNWEYQTGYSVGASLTHSERAPSHQELFSAGEHISTRTFDLGLAYQLNADGSASINNDIREETANNLDLSWRKFQGGIHADFTLFYNRVDNYIFQRNSGLQSPDEDELPLFVFQQSDAELYGFEAGVSFPLNAFLSWDIGADYIRASLRSGEPLPRIPPLRIATKLKLDTKTWRADLGASWYDEQDRTAPLESTSAAYTLIDASLRYRFDLGASALDLFLIGHNLTDEEARPHTSFIKDEAPLPGRGVSLGLELNF